MSEPYDHTKISANATRRGASLNGDIADPARAASTGRHPRHERGTRRFTGLTLLEDRIRSVPRVYFGITVAYLFVRVLAVVGAPVTGSFPDSGTYRQGVGQLTYPFVSLTGHAMRPWVAPLLYAILPSDSVRTDAQIVISILAWLVLAATVSTALRDRRVRVIAFVVILALSCTAAVASWDRAILSESTAVSFAVLAVAAWIRFGKNPSVMNSIAVVASMTLWSFTKSAMFPVVGLAAVLLLVSMIPTHEIRLRGIVAAALILVSVWGLAANANSDKTWKLEANQGLTQFNLNFANFLRLELLDDPGGTAWFVAHGMPDPTGLVAYERSNPDDSGWLDGEPSFIQAYLARADLVGWGNDKGRGVYAKYVATHSRKLVARFSRELPYMLVPPRSELVYATGSRDVLPSVAQSLLFDTTPAVSSPGEVIPPAAFGDVSLLVAACLVLAFVPRRRARDRRLLVTAGATFVLSLVALALGWLLSPVELVRHAIPASVLLRLSLWLMVFGMLDAVVRGSRKESAVDR